jgi:NDP-sugar pyrophosphorylase family protein
LQASAIVVIGNQFAPTTLWEFAHRESLRPVSGGCLEILGRSVLELTVIRLRQAGIKTISVIAEAGSLPFWPARDLEIIAARQSSDHWPRAMRKLRDYASHGIEDVLVMELGAYAECDFGEALQFHRSVQSTLTQLQDSQQPLDFWIVKAGAMRTAALEYSLPFGLDKMLGPAAPFPIKGYVNRLADARDLRKLVVDAFLGHCTIRPRGREVRPGVWMDDGARPHRSARIVAPAYLGHAVKLEPSSVIARFSNVERNCRVGEGTVVESASVLSHTALGRGLDVSQAVVHGNEFVDLARNLVIRIDDPNLLRDTAPQPWRVPKPQRETSESLDARNPAFELEGGLQGEV